MNRIPKRKWDRQEWTESVERALGRLVESVTAKRIDQPPLTNEQYRAIGSLANLEGSARAAFEQYSPELNADPDDLLDLLGQHPVIKGNSEGTGRDAATFVLMPSRGFRMELLDLIRNLTRTAVRRGCREATVLIDRFLTLSGEDQVPGYEIWVFGGVTMTGQAQISEGLDILALGLAVQRGLVGTQLGSLRNDPLLPAAVKHDYVAMGALVLARKMTWGPCLVPPSTANDSASLAPKPKFQCLAGCSEGVIFDLLRISASHRVEKLADLVCAPDFVDVSPAFGPTSWGTFFNDHAWTKKDLTPEHIGDLRDLVSAWSRFEVEKRSTLELGLDRIASSIQRNRGRFSLQDRILDTAIALEVLYELQSPELSYRLQTRAGHLLSDTTEGRINIGEEVKQFYGLRSSIAHGKKRVDGKASADSGFALAQRTLRELLRRGSFPDWERLVMSSSNPPA